MSSQRVVGPEPRRAARLPENVVPLFVCPGAKDVPVEHAFFPMGDGFSEMRPCPRRRACLWYAAHDLGGRTRFNELPDGVLISADFLARPFSCPRFHGHAEARPRGAPASAMHP